MTETKRIEMVEIQVINGLEYANLGGGDFAEELAEVLVAKYGGHTIVSDDCILYYNSCLQILSLLSK